MTGKTFGPGIRGGSRADGAMETAPALELPKGGTDINCLICGESTGFHKLLEQKPATLHPFITADERHGEVVCPRCAERINEALIESGTVTLEIVSEPGGGPNEIIWKGAGA